MAIYQPRESRRWWVSIYRPGKPRFRQSTGTEIREEAELIERTMRLAYLGKTPRQRLHAALDALLGPDGEQQGGLPLQSAWEAYQHAQAASGNRPLSPLTAAQRRAVVRRFARWTTEHWPRAKTMQDVDRQCAFAFSDMLHKSGATAKTRATLIGDLATVWKTLTIRAGMTENPWPLVRPRPGEGKHGRAFTAAEEESILKAAESTGHDWHPVCLVARYTGLRYGDVARLRWDSVDLAGGRLTVRPSKTARHGIELGIPLHPRLRQLLSARRDDGTGFVFPEHARKYGHIHESAPFKSILKAAGVTGATFHSWRHTFRTRISEAGAPQEIAMALGGWSQAATAGMYSHDWGALDKAIRSMK
jgi:integrase